MRMNSSPTSARLKSLPRSVKRPRFAGQQGFTLIEAVIATGILITGLVAVSNLMFVAISSNSIANWTSGATFMASQKLEELRSTSFQNLLDSPPPPAPPAPLPPLPPGATSLDADTPGYNEDVTVDGLGVFHTRWRIVTVGGAWGNNLKFLAVRTEIRGPLSRRTQTEFTTFRACTLAACP